MTGALFVACSFLLVRQTFDIRVFDTFYVIKLKYLYLMLAGSLAACWLVYRFIKVNFFSSSLVNIHIILTMLASLLIVIFHISSGQLYFFRTGLNLYDVLRYQKNNFILIILVMVLAGVQCLFAFNFLLGLRKQKI